MRLQVVATVGFVFLLLASGCASSRHAMHSFGFDARVDSPDAEILDYRYGDSKQPGARPADWMLRQGRVPQWNAMTGEMLRPDVLFVKWRVKSTGELYEDTVELRSRLPADITDHRVYFLVDGPQLYVYLISRERRPDGVAPQGPRTYQHLKSTLIYPSRAAEGG